MCETCYEEYGSPKIDNEGVRAAVYAIGELYCVHGAGGCLHIVTDDWNLEDNSLEFCLKYANERGGFDEVEQACYDALLPLTEKERASALAWQWPHAVSSIEYLIDGKEYEGDFDIEDHGHGKATVHYRLKE